MKWEWLLKRTDNAAFFFHSLSVYALPVVLVSCHHTVLHFDTARWPQLRLNDTKAGVRRSKVDPPRLRSVLNVGCLRTTDTVASRRPDGLERE
ncbi:hypothetical protein GE09DRAFT_1149641 [Coniochaeta sp. 2T2.1]|nr:hypothetical protein GE09DRAFT_1149641 [Coniochaeta sp. 2T2.1]